MIADLLTSGKWVLTLTRPSLTRLAKGALAFSIFNLNGVLGLNPLLAL